MSNTPIHHLTADELAALSAFGDTPAVYVSARFGEIGRANVLAAQLRAAGCYVTSRWLDEVPSTDFDLLSDAQRAECARRDAEDIYRATIFVSLIPRDGQRGRHGARHVEFGLALAYETPIIVVGQPRENVFHYYAAAGLHFLDDDASVSMFVAELWRLRCSR